MSAAPRPALHRHERALGRAITPNLTAVPNPTITTTPATERKDYSHERNYPRPEHHGRWLLAASTLLGTALAVGPAMEHERSRRDAAGG